MREPITPIEDLFGGQTWDVFLSHASEDKEAVAVPLRDALTARGVTVWLDKTEMRIGDSLQNRRRNSSQSHGHRGALGFDLQQGLDEP
jgi:hypothetical protein